MLNLSLVSNKKGILFNYKDNTTVKWKVGYKFMFSFKNSYH